jgi:undecaprenyl-diphosphatase
MVARKLKQLYQLLLKTEFSILLALGVLGLALLGFAGLVDEVFEGDMHAFDKKILLALRHATDLANPAGPKWLEDALADITSLGSTTVLTLITLCVMVYLLIDKKRAAALFVFFAVGGGTLLMNLLKLGFQRPRPDLVPHLAQVYDYSFPSGHTTMATITYLTLGALLARVEKQTRIKVFVMGVAVVLALLVGFSRVYLGVHWPTDVMAGWSLGAAWAMLCWLAARWLQHHGRMENEKGQLKKD